MTHYIKKYIELAWRIAIHAYFFDKEQTEYRKTIEIDKKIINVFPFFFFFVKLLSNYTVQRNLIYYIYTGLIVHTFKSPEKNRDEGSEERDLM